MPQSRRQDERGRGEYRAVSGVEHGDVGAWTPPASVMPHRVGRLLLAATVRVAWADGRAGGQQGGLFTHATIYEVGCATPEPGKANADATH
jgi:hypothetical protein